jgi:hypothetical protein
MGFVRDQVGRWKSNNRENRELNGGAKEVAADAYVEL